MKKTRKKSKKNNIFFSFMLLIFILLALFILIQLQRKIGYAYRIQFMQPHIPKDEIIEAIKSVDQSYLEGIHTIEIVDMFLDYDGLYILGGRIRLNVKGGFRKEVLLHELKHHFCWKKENYLGHEGCFKEPPLIVEEPVKDEVIIPELLEENIPNCFDNIQNQNETGVDCGGPCIPCEKEVVEMLAPPSKRRTDIFIFIGLFFFTIWVILIISHYKKMRKETHNLNNK